MGKDMARFEAIVFMSKLFAELDISMADAGRFG